MSATLVQTPPVGGAAGDPTTLPGWLVRNSQERPRGVAIRVKELGRWREITWHEHEVTVASVGRALAHVGVASGSRVLLVSENRPEWVATDLAVQGLGAVTVGVFPTTPAEELADLVTRSGARIAIVEDEEQLDKLTEGAGAPSLERIFVIDTRGIRRLVAPAASFEELAALGTPDAVALREGAGDAWHDAVRALEPEQLATIVFTPGTTGEPKGVLLTHANLAAAAAAGATELELGPRDRIVSCLPLCEITERNLVVGQATRSGCIVHFGEGGDALENDLREVEPTVFLGTPRLWGGLRRRIESGLRNAGHIKRWAFRVSAKPYRSSVLAWKSHVLVTNPARRRVGLGKVRLALSGSAPAPVELLEWWSKVGLDVREVYGLTESTGVATAVPAGTSRPGTVGRALPGVEVTVADPDAEGRGEVRVRGPVVCSGYLDDPAATSAARTDDGWLRTGDIGALDADGALTIVDRTKDVLITSGGHTVAPGSIERRLTGSPYVRAAVVVGDGRPCVGALIAIDDVAVVDWASEHGVPFTTHASLATSTEVHDLMRDWVDEVNAGLAADDRVGRFAVLPAELTHDDGALTATYKVRRGATAEQFAALVEEMYR